MKRFDDWPGLLDTFVASRRDMPFRWGANDCCLFACDAVLIMTGEDLAHGFRATYDTPHSAKKAIEDFGAEGVGELADLIAERFDLRCIPPLYAQRGDIVLLDGEHGESLGIVSLDGTDVWAPGEERLARIAITDGQRAWRI
jgi:hypothetical protein